MPPASCDTAAVPVKMTDVDVSFAIVSTALVAAVVLIVVSLANIVVIVVVRCATTVAGSAEDALRGRTYCAISDCFSMSTRR